MRLQRDSLRFEGTIQDKVSCFQRERSLCEGKELEAEALKDPRLCKECETPQLMVDDSRIIEEFHRAL